MTLRSAFRSLVAIVVGFVAATLVMMSVETVNGRFLYPDLGRAAQGVTDREAIRALMAMAPVGAFLVVIFGWALGTLVGAWASAWIGRRAPLGHALAVGGLLALAGVANNLMLPPPLWVWVASLAVFFPAAYAGARLAPRPARDAR